MKLTEGWFKENAVAPFRKATFIRFAASVTLESSLPLAAQGSKVGGQPDLDLGNLVTDDGSAGQNALSLCLHQCLVWMAPA